MSAGAAAGHGEAAPLAAAPDGHDGPQRLQIAETALAESEGRFRHLVESVPALFWAAEPSGAMRFTSKQWRDFAGLTAESSGWEWMEVIHPEDGERCRAAWAQAMATGEVYEIELRNRRAADGEYRWLHTRAIPQRGPGGEIEGWYGATSDVTERHEAEEALRRRNEGLHLLGEAAAKLLAAVDGRGLVAPLFDTISGYLGADVFFSYVATAGPGEELHLLLDEAGGIEAGTRARFARLAVGQSLCGLAARGRRPLYLAQLQTSSEPEAAVLKAIGARAYFCNPLLSGGRLIGTLSFASRTKDAFEPEALELMGAVSHYVAMTRERLRSEAESRRLIAQLRRSNAAKDELFGLVSHEFRTPLTTITGMADMLVRRGEALTPEARAEALRDLQGEGERLRRLVRNMLTLARAELAEDVAPEPVMLQRVVPRLVAIVAGGGGRVVCRLPRNLPAVLAHEGYLEQVLENLVTNARKYAAADTPIEVRALAGPEAVALTVADRGPELDPAEVAHYFEPFYRGARHRELSGSPGLGMAVCRRLAEAMGGEIEAHARAGGGLEVTLRLPLARDEG